MNFSFTVYNRHASAQGNDLIAVGLPFARGVLAAPELLQLHGPDGSPVPCQVRVLAHWPAGGVRWALVRFAGQVGGHSQAVYRVTVGEGEPASAARGTHGADALLQRTPDGGLRIDTGVLQLELSRDPRQWIASVALPPHPRGQSDKWAQWTPEVQGGQWYVDLAEDSAAAGQGQPAGSATPRADRLTPRFDGPAKILDNGALVGEALYNGHFADEVGTDVLRFMLRVVVQRDSRLIRLSYTLHNPRHQPREEMGHWRLGLPNAALIREAGLRLGLPKEGIPYVFLSGDETGGRSVGAAKTSDASPACADHLGPLTAETILHQDSSGGVNWRHRNHVNRHNEIMPRFRGFRMTESGRVTNAGHRAAGWAAVGHQRVGLAIGVEKFWQNFPKAFRALPGDSGVTLECALFPPLEGELFHELQGGEQKTHHLVVSFHRTDAPAESSPRNIPVPNLVYPGLKNQMERILTQPLTLPSAEQVLASEFMQPTTAYDEKQFAEYEAVVAGNLEDPAFNLFDLREKWDEYGWRSFGDINADCEIGGLIHSHYNNEYDLSRGMLFQALRRSGPAIPATGSAHPATVLACRQWAELGLDAARHQADIDIYHTSEDPHEGGVYNGAKFTHTAHALEVGRATHRQSESHAMWGELDWPWGRGGGPESGHFDNEGMLLAYYLTGDPVLRHASLEIAECVVFKVSNNKFPQHAYDRSSGNNLACVLDAWRNTWDDRYRACIETILDKTRLSAQHGKIPIDAEGLAPIGSWSASIFLKSALRFLYEYKQVAGEVHAKGWEIVREYVDSWHKYGWDEKLGRFHPVVPHEASREVSGSGSDYADAAWFTIDALGFAAMFREEPALRERDMQRCIRAFKSYCEVRAPGRKPVYWNTKVTTFSINNGHSVLYAMKSKAPGKTRSRPPMNTDKRGSKAQLRKKTKTRSKAKTGRR